MNRPLRSFAAVVLALLCSGPLAREACADFLLGVTYYDNQLIKIDTTTGVGSLVGNLSTNVGAFGLSQYNGNLYTFDSTLDRVAQINSTTGATMADINVGIGPVLGQGGMAIRSDGIGFLTSALDPSTFNPVNDVFSFNLATGKSTLLSTSPTGPTLAGLAFLGNTLYGLGKLDGMLYTVNQSTGLATAVGSLGYLPGNPFESLSAGPGGTLYATLDDRLFSINTATGLATPIDPNPANDSGFSSISGLVSPAAVPEPSSIVLVAVGLGSALIVPHRWRGRRVR